MFDILPTQAKLYRLADCYANDYYIAGHDNDSQRVVKKSAVFWWESNCTERAMNNNREECSLDHSTQRTFF